MEEAMEQDKDLADYRARLLDGLKERTSRSTCGPSDPVQVFVNERRVGCFGGRETDATVQFHCQGRVDHVQLRSEDGVLLGGLSAPELGFRAARIPLSRDSVEIRIHNSAQGGSASAVFIPAPRRWHQLGGGIAGSARASDRDRPATGVAPSPRVVLVTQALLAIIVLGLAADRITAWMTPGRPAFLVTGAEAPQPAAPAEVAKLERRLDDVARMHTKTAEALQSQQQGMAQLQLAIAKLSSAQDAVASGMRTVRQEMEGRQKGGGRELPQMTRMLMSQAQTDQEHLEAEILSLTRANERLSKEMAGLVEQNRDLEKKLKSTGLDVSKAAGHHQDEVLSARRLDAQSSTSPALTDAPVAPQPFLFWVNFSEGTTEENIDQWVNEMHGRKGAVTEGWQEVQVMQPSMPTDRFLEQVKGAKIVKAVRVNQ
jgi:hypothetical protein